MDRKQNTVQKRNKMLDHMPLYARLWSGVMQPAFERFRGKSTPIFEKKLLTSQWLSREELEEQRWRDLDALLIYASNNVPFYEDWFKGKHVNVRDIIQKRDLSILPLVDRDIMVKSPERFRPRRSIPGTFEKCTGGTTGAPFRFLVNPTSEHWRTAISRRAYAWAGCVPGRRQVHLWSSDVIALPFFKRAKRSFHRKLMNQYYINSFNMLCSDDLDDVLKKINNFMPDCMVVYPSSVEILGKYIIQTGAKIRRKMVSIIGGGEAVFPGQREIIEKAFQCPLFETYGNREFMLIAAECEEHQGLHVSVENLMVEIIKNGIPVPSNTIGEVVVTDLHNYAQPFIRYRTEDLSAIAEKPCPCGRSSSCLTGVEGRELDIIRGPDGSLLSGHFLPHFVQNYKAINRFQVEQDRLDHVIIRVVLNDQLKDADKQFIIFQVENMLPGIHAEVQEVQKIKLTKSGKHRTTIGLGHKIGG